MRLTTALTLLFATVALAAPAAEANPEAAVAASKAELEARGSCPAGCACDKGRCNCATCNPVGCTWYYNGQTC
ncbi:hypothetical protein B0T20DRAFT_509847 [Sordaria brevicollis]|uniref:Uncharacterized protein n=1 Tax=Sordaria brevicollis TaxID=83679 RepID=A0AAE0P3N4_SORBR|nr:hypothetical protein B0T20DRAFT_509847 [Sordaria brevicollis]